MAKYEIKGGNLIITLPLEERPSKSGKNTVIASTGGNKVTDLIHKGKPVTVGVNAYVDAK